MGFTRVTTIAGAVAAATMLFTATAGAAPIADTGVPSIPTYQGEPAVKNPIPKPTKPEQNPFMAANPNSNIHNDTWMTDAYNRKRPARRHHRSSRRYSLPVVALRLARLRLARAGSSSVCPSIPFPPQARIIDPDTLAPIDTLRPADGPEPAGTERVPELRRRRLLLPRPEGPDLGRRPGPITSS